MNDHRPFIKTCSIRSWVKEMSSNPDSPKLSERQVFKWLLDGQYLSRVNNGLGHPAGYVPSPLYTGDGKRLFEFHICRPNPSAPEVCVTRITSIGMRELTPLLFDDFKRGAP